MGNQQRSPEKGNAQRLNDLFKTGERITSDWLSVMVDYLLNRNKHPICSGAYLYTLSLQMVSLRSLIIMLKSTTIIV